MLKFKYLFDNKELVKELIQNWNYDEEKLDKDIEAFRISSNAVYPFTYLGKRQFIRFSPTSEKDIKQLKGVMEFIQFLRKEKFPVMEPVESKNKNLIEKTTTPWGEYFVSVFKRVPGMRLDTIDFSEEAYYNYGKSLANFHLLSKKYSPNHLCWSYEDVLSWIIKTIKENNGDPIIIDLVNQLKNELKKLPKNDDNFGLIHYDYELDNILYDENEKECWVIDLDDAMYHWYLMDIYKAFYSIEDELPKEKVEKAKEYFLNGYKEVKKLSDGELSYLSLFKNFEGLYRYARMLYSSSEEVSEKPEWMVSIEEDFQKEMKKIIMNFNQVKR